MKNFVFTVDDNIRFLKELSEGNKKSLFSHPYCAMYRRLHEKYGLKVQMNLFYEMSGFTLSEMTGRFQKEFSENADWLKLSFHSLLENVEPYLSSGYSKVYADCQAVHREILRFAHCDLITVIWAEVGYDTASKQQGGSQNEADGKISHHHRRCADHGRHGKSLTM